MYCTCTSVYQKYNNTKLTVHAYMYMHIHVHVQQQCGFILHVHVHYIVLATVKFSSHNILMVFHYGLKHSDNDILHAASEHDGF